MCLSCDRRHSQGAACGACGAAPRAARRRKRPAPLPRQASAPSAWRWWAPAGVDGAPQRCVAIETSAGAPLGLCVTSWYHYHCDLCGREIWWLECRVVSCDMGVLIRACIAAGGRSFEVHLGRRVCARARARAPARSRPAAALGVALWSRRLGSDPGTFWGALTALGGGNLAYVSIGDGAGPRPAQ